MVIVISKSTRAQNCDELLVLSHPATSAPFGDVTVAGTGHHGDDCRQRVRDGCDRRRASPARQRRQLSDSVAGRRRPAGRRPGHAVGRRQRRDARLAARTTAVRRLGVLRRALLYVVYPPPRRHLTRPLLGRHSRRLYTQQVHSSVDKISSKKPSCRRETAHGSLRAI